MSSRNSLSHSATSASMSPLLSASWARRRPPRSRLASAKYPSAALNYSVRMATPDTLPPSGSTDTAARHRETARRALEEVCSGRDLAAVEEVYSPLFVDHVNALEYHGTE